MSGPATSLKSAITGQPKVQFPGASPEEAALQREHAALLREQRALLQRQLREQDLLAGFALEEAGFRARRDERGNLVGFEPIPEAELSPAKLEERQIEQLFRQRSLAALRGELPVSPALTRSLTEDRQNLEARLRRELGPGFATSTPGIQALAEQELRGNELLESARRGDLTLAEQLGQARSAANLATAGGNIGELFGISQRGLPFVQAGLGVASGFQQPISNLFQERVGRFQAKSLTEQLREQRFAQIAAGFRQDSATFGQIFGGP